MIPSGVLKACSRHVRRRQMTFVESNKMHDRKEEDSDPQSGRDDVVRCSDARVFEDFHRSLIHLLGIRLSIQTAPKLGKYAPPCHASLLAYACSVLPPKFSVERQTS